MRISLLIIVFLSSCSIMVESEPYIVRWERTRTVVDNPPVISLTGVPLPNAYFRSWVRRTTAIYSDGSKVDTNFYLEVATKPEYDAYRSGIGYDISIQGVSYPNVFPKQGIVKLMDATYVVLLYDDMSIQYIGRY